MSQETAEIVLVRRVDHLPAMDLQGEAVLRGNTARSYIVEVAGHAEGLSVLLVPEAGRAGVAWGADAQWTDVTSDGEAGAREAAELFLSGRMTP